MGYKKNIASNFVTQTITSGLAFVVSVIVSRVLGTDGRGEAAYFLLFFTTIGQYGHFGITYATPYFSKKTEYSSEYVFNSNFTYTIIVCTLLSTGILFGRIFGLVLIEYNYFMIVLGVLVLVFTMIAEFLSTFYISNERIVEVNKISLASNLIKLFSIIVLWLTNTLTLYTYLIIVSIPAIYNSVFLKKNLKTNFKFALDMLLIKREFKFGMIIYLATFFIFMNYKVDQYFIKFMLDTSELGVYTVAVSLAELLFLIPSSVASAILGRLYNISSDDTKERKRITSSTVKITFYITFILMIVGILCTPLIPIIYGVEYTGAIVPTIVLFIGILFASIGKISASYFQSTGQPKIHLIIAFIVFTSNIVLNTLLIPIIGIIGAGLASTISYIFYGILYIICFIVIEKFTFKDFFFINESDKENIRIIRRKIIKR